MISPEHELHEKESMGICPEIRNEFSPNQDLYEPQGGKFGTIFGDRDLESPENCPDRQLYRQQAQYNTR